MNSMDPAPESPQDQPRSAAKSQRALEDELVSRVSHRTFGDLIRLKDNIYAARRRMHVTVVVASTAIAIGIGTVGVLAYKRPGSVADPRTEQAIKALEEARVDLLDTRVELQKAVDDLNNVAESLKLMNEVAQSVPTGTEQPAKTASGQEDSASTSTEKPAATDAGTSPEATEND